MNQTNETKPTTAKQVPTLDELKKTKKGRFGVKKLLIGLVFACSFVSALQGSLATVPFAFLAYWMSTTQSVHETTE